MCENHEMSGAVKGMVDVIKWRLISILVVTASCRTQYKLCVDMIG